MIYKYIPRPLILTIKCKKGIKGKFPCWFLSYERCYILFFSRVNITHGPSLCQVLTALKAGQGYHGLGHPRVWSLELGAGEEGGAEERRGADACCWEIPVRAADSGAHSDMKEHSARHRDVIIS